MIIILNGPLGIGKTTTAWTLLGKFTRAIMLDGDYIGAVHPFNLYDEKRIEYLYKTMAHLVQYHQQSNYNDFVVNYVFETPAQLEKLIKYLSPLDGEIRSFLLVGSREETERRIRLRNSPDLEWELQRSAELAGILDKNIFGVNLGQPVDTTLHSVEEVTEILWSAIVT